MQLPCDDRSGSRRLDQFKCNQRLSAVCFRAQSVAPSTGYNGRMTEGGLEKGFAGLPSGSTQTSGVMTTPSLQGSAYAPHLPNHTARPYKRYRLPNEVVGSGWATSGFTDEDLEFGMTEITTDQRLRASRLAGTKMDFQAVNMEQTFQCIYMIGGKLTNNNRGVIKGWFEAIGPKGQDIVERIFAEMTSATETEVQAVMGAGSWEAG